jgi:hypothetical protein
MTPSYYPHWAWRKGDVTRVIRDGLEPGTIVGVHHSWSQNTIRKILDHPEKEFRIAWCADGDTRNDDDPGVGMSVKKRIAQARALEEALKADYPAERFSGLFEINSARDKADGDLGGDGNRKSDWLKDAAAVNDAGFRYLARNPSIEMLDALEKEFGADFCARLVFEDVTATSADDNQGYREDALTSAARGLIITLVIHEGRHDGFPATTARFARRAVAEDFALPTVEAYFGRRGANSKGFTLLKRFGSAQIGQIDRDYQSASMRDRRVHVCRFAECPHAGDYE